MSENSRKPENPRLVAGSEVRLRDLFAAAALAGLVADRGDFDETWSEVAETAYHIADAMLEERELP